MYLIVAGSVAVLLGVYVGIYIWRGKRPGNKGAQVEAFLRGHSTSGAVAKWFFCNSPVLKVKDRGRKHRNSCLLPLKY